MITGAYDIGSCVKFPEILEVNLAGIGVSVPTECAHLFSESAQDGDKVFFLLVSCMAPFLIYTQPSEYAGTAFTMLKMFDLDHEVEKLLGGQVTLKSDMHDAFDRFAIWLEEVPGQVCHCAPTFFLSHDKANPIPGKYLYRGNG